jgi:hypothetical protein
VTPSLQELLPGRQESGRTGPDVCCEAGSELLRVVVGAAVRVIAEAEKAQVLLRCQGFMVWTWGVGVATSKAIQGLGLGV